MQNRINDALADLTGDPPASGPTKGSPTGIGDWNDLDEVRDNPGATYTLLNDLDSSTAGYDSVVDPAGGGFTPITPFYGTFDGNGHVIRDLVVDTDGFGGLFGQTGASGSPGEITDLGLENVDISGEGSVGALVGSNSATITRVYVTGDVQGGDGTLPTTGGLVGTTDGNISKSFSAATVEGPDNVGGLVGKNEEATIEKSYATGDVDVTGEYAFGGALVGNNNFSGSVVTNAYATGKVSAGLGGGGLIGNAANGELKDSYWDKGTTNQDGAVGPGGSSGSGFVGFGSTSNTEPANEMTGDDAPNNMRALDFTNTWDTVSGDYPILQSIDQGAQ
ncbi:The GLUG motif-containing protein [Halorubrum aquaticum]|uniref:The GLUG motif-containing protein n=2 Tax=Halorubrum aquaticum TaxID=387340 RepID=A0A1I3ALA4_9EURY|nr:The GLUG motif-containing protein [Halorubrum aquaticum]